MLDIFGSLIPTHALTRLLTILTFPFQPPLFSMFMTEHLEKYVMLKLYRVAFHECVESARERDTWFEKRMQVLRKVLTADHLDVNPSCRRA